MVCFAKEAVCPVYLVTNMWDFRDILSASGLNINVLNAHMVTSYSGDLVQRMLSGVGWKHWSAAKHSRITKRWHECDSIIYLCKVSWTFHQALIYNEKIQVSYFLSLSLPQLLWHWRMVCVCVVRTYCFTRFSLLVNCCHIHFLFIDLSPRSRRSPNQL